MAKVLPQKPMSLESFNWFPKTKSLTAFASDFGPLSDGCWWLGQLYSDACDIGIEIKSHRTGKSFVFLCKETPSETREYYRFEPLDSACPATEAVVYWD